MSEVTHQQACKDVEATTIRLGTSAARRIMGKVAADWLEPDVMQAMAEAEADQIFHHFVENGATENDAHIVRSIFVLALVREGKRISMALDMTGGTA